MGNGKKARDVDRDLAIDFVEAAWVDGQLTRAELDSRVDRLLRARTLPQLEHEVADLQGPGGTPWSPEPDAVPVSHRAQDAARNAPRAGRTGEAPARRGAIVLAAFALIVAALLLIPSGGDEAAEEPYGDSAPVRAQGADAPSPLSMQGYRELVAAVDDATGETSAFEVVLDADGAQGLFPAEVTGDAAESREWDGQAWSEPTVTSSDRERFGLEMITPGMIEAAALQAVSVHGDEADVVLRLGLEREDGVRTCLRAESTPPGGETVVARYDCQGRLIDGKDAE